MSDQKDDKDLFRSQYGDIERIKDDRVSEWRPRLSTKPKPRSTRLDQDDLAITPWPELDDRSSGSINNSYRANGVQEKLARKLRRRQLKPQASIDLHGMTRVIALQELQGFIDECRLREINCIHIVHGKGYQSADGKAILKPSVAIWLRQMPEVLAFCPALANDGGEGALYVLLKKSKS